MDNRKPRVLLADDEPFHRVPYRRSLERQGFDVIEAEDYAGVVAHGLTVDALVVDAMLPTVRLEGLKAADELVRQGLPAAVPLIFVSSQPEHVLSVQQALKALPALHGRYEWIEKPFEPTTLGILLWRRLRQAQPDQYKG